MTLWKRSGSWNISGKGARIVNARLFVSIWNHWRNCTRRVFARLFWPTGRKPWFFRLSVWIHSWKICARAWDPKFRRNQIDAWDHSLNVMQNQPGPSKTRKFWLTRLRIQASLPQNRDTKTSRPQKPRPRARKTPKTKHSITKNHPKPFRSPGKTPMQA